MADETKAPASQATDSPPALTELDIESSVDAVPDPDSDSGSDGTPCASLGDLFLVEPNEPPLPTWTHPTGAFDVIYSRAPSGGVRGRHGHGDKLWPASEFTARLLGDAEGPWAWVGPETRVLEVGCGSALPSLVCAHRGATVVITDALPPGDFEGVRESLAANQERRQAAAAAAVAAVGVAAAVATGDRGDGGDEGDAGDTVDEGDRIDVPVKSWGAVYVLPYLWGEPGDELFGVGLEKDAGEEDAEADGGNVGTEGSAVRAHGEEGVNPVAHACAKGGDGDGRFDLVIASECLWMCDYHDHLLRGIKACLATRGKALVSFALHENVPDAEILHFFTLAEEQYELVVRRTHEHLWDLGQSSQACGLSVFEQTRTMHVFELSRRGSGVGV